MISVRGATPCPKCIGDDFCLKCIENTPCCICRQLDPTVDGIICDDCGLKGMTCMPCTGLIRAPEGKWFCDICDLKKRKATLLENRRILSDQFIKQNIDHILVKYIMNLEIDIDILEKKIIKNLLK